MEKHPYGKPVAIIYHAGCLDGVAAAAAVMDDLINDPSLTYDVETYPVTYKSPVPNLDGKEVYIVDFSWPPEVLLPAISKANVTMIDHHQTAIDQWEGVDLPPNLKLVFDTSMSGSLLTWTTIVKNNKDASDAPKLLKHVSDRDLWKFEDRDTKYVCEYVMGRMSDLSSIGQFHRMYRDSIQNEVSFFRDAVQFGQVMVHCRETLASKALARNSAKFRVFGYDDIPVANLPYEYTSDAGDLLGRYEPFVVIYEDNLSTGMRRFSLRSNKKSANCVNVRELAERMGGGGHDNAAGFYIPLKDIKDGEFKFFG